jgi:hypothetical protein
MIIISKAVRMNSPADIHTEAAPDGQIQTGKPSEAASDTTEVFSASLGRPCIVGRRLSPSGLAEHRGASKMNYRRREQQHAQLSQNYNPCLRLLMAALGTKGIATNQTNQ